MALPAATTGRSHLPLHSAAVYGLRSESAVGGSRHVQLQGMGAAAPLPPTVAMVTAPAAVSSTRRPLVADWQLHRSSNGQLFVYGYAYECSGLSLVPVSRFISGTLVGLDGREYDLLNPDYDIRTGSMVSTGSPLQPPATDSYRAPASEAGSPSWLQVGSSHWSEQHEYRGGPAEPTKWTADNGCSPALTAATQPQPPNDRHRRGRNSKMAASAVACDRLASSPSSESLQQLLPLPPSPFRANDGLSSAATAATAGGSGAASAADRHAVLMQPLAAQLSAGRCCQCGHSPADGGLADDSCAASADAESTMVLVPSPLHLADELLRKEVHRVAEAAMTASAAAKRTQRPTSARADAASRWTEQKETKPAVSLPLHSAVHVSALPHGRRPPHEVPQPLARPALPLAEAGVPATNAARDRQQRSADSSAARQQPRGGRQDDGAAAAAAAFRLGSQLPAKSKHGRSRNCKLESHCQQRSDAGAADGVCRMQPRAHTRSRPERTGQSPTTEVTAPVEPSRKRCQVDRGMAAECCPKRLRAGAPEEEEHVDRRADAQEHQQRDDCGLSGTTARHPWPGRARRPPARSNRHPSASGEASQSRTRRPDSSPARSSADSDDVASSVAASRRRRKRPKGSLLRLLSLSPTSDEHRSAAVSPASSPDSQEIRISRKGGVSLRRPSKEVLPPCLSQQKNVHRAADARKEKAAAVSQLVEPDKPCGYSLRGNRHGTAAVGGHNLSIGSTAEPPASKCNLLVARHKPLVGHHTGQADGRAVSGRADVRDCRAPSHEPHTVAAAVTTVAAAARCTSKAAVDDNSAAASGPEALSASRSLGTGRSVAATPARMQARTTHGRLDKTATSSYGAAKQTASYSSHYMKKFVANDPLD